MRGKQLESTDRKGSEQVIRKRQHFLSSRRTSLPLISMDFIQFSIKIFILNCLLAAPLSLAWFQSCPSTGVQRCISGQLPYSVNTTTSVSNCIFIGCPQVRLTSGVLSISNVTFRDNNAAANGVNGGGAIWMVGNPSTTGLLVNNCTFLNNSAPNGGAIYVYGPFNNQVQISNSIFLSNTATSTSTGNGGAIAIYYSVTASITNCKFITNRARIGGGLYAESSSTIDYNNNNCFQNTGTSKGGCIYIFQSTTFRSVNVVGDGDYGPGGAGFFHADTGNTVNFTGVYLNNPTGLSGSAFYSFGPGMVAIRNVFIQGAVVLAPNNVNGITVMQGSTYGFFDNVTIVNGVGGFAHISYGSNVTWNNGLIKNHRGVSVLQNQYGTYTTTIYNSVIIQDCTTLSGSGSVLLGVIGFVYMNDCQINNIVSVSQGAFSLQSCSLTLTRTSVINAVNTGGNGGLIYTSGSGTVTFNSGVVIRNISSVASGGIFYLAGSGNLSLASDVSITNYSAGDSLSTFAYMAGNPNGIFSGTPIQSAAIDPGTVFVLNPSVATMVVRANLINGFLPSGIKWNSNVPSCLRMLNANQLNTVSIIRSSLLPSVQLTTMDFFGNDLPFNPAIPYVVIQMVEVLQGATVTGETIKVIIDPVTNAIEFRNNDIKNKQPGLYSIQFRGIFNSLNPIPTNAWPTFNVTVTDCDPNAERLIPSLNLCFTAIPINQALRLVSSAISIVGMVVLLGTIGLLIKYREHKVIKANSFVFITISLLGSIFALASIPVQASQFASSCMVSFWLENIGFTLNIVSLIIKMNRLQKIFLKTLQSKVRSNLSDRVLLRYLMMGVVAMIIYLIIWTASQPSTLVDQTFLSRKSIAINRCSTSTFNLVIITAKFLATLFAAQIAYSIKHIPSNFNESRVIGIACYNWVVFGTILNLINQGAVQDPSAYFAINVLAILFPHLSSAYLLAISRVYICYLGIVEESSASAPSKSADGKGTNTKGRSPVIKNSASIKA